jgi:hypothetical protein
MSALKGLEFGGRIGAAFGPEGEVVGAGVGGLLGLATAIGGSLRSRDPGTHEEKQSLISRDTFESSRGIARIHHSSDGGSATIRQRRPIITNQPDLVDVPLNNPPPQRSNIPRLNVRSIDRYGRRPLIAAIAASGIATGVAATQTPDGSVSFPQPGDSSGIINQPGDSSGVINQPGNNTPIGPEQPILPANPEVEAKVPEIIQPSNPPTFRRPAPFGHPDFASRPTINYKYVGNYRFPMGAYNYIQYNNYIRNNTLASLN